MIPPSKQRLYLATLVIASMCLIIGRMQILGRAALAKVRAHAEDALKIEKAVVGLESRLKLLIPLDP